MYSTNILDEIDNKRNRINSFLLKGYISEAEYDILMNRLDFIQENAIKSAINKSVDMGKKAYNEILTPTTKVGRAINKGGHALNSGMNYVADKGAKTAVRIAHMREGKTADEIYAKYENEVKRWKLGFKAAQILATGALAIGPIDIVVKGMIAAGIQTSKDPDDKKVSEVVSKLKDKANELINSVKGHKIKSESELNSKVNNILNAGKGAAKSVDSAVRRKMKLVRDKKYITVQSRRPSNSTKTVKEYTLDDPFDIILEGVISDLDYNDSRDLSILEFYIDSIEI